MKAYMDAFLSGHLGATMALRERLTATERLAVCFFMSGSLCRSCFGAEVGRA